MAKKSSKKAKKPAKVPKINTPNFVKNISRKRWTQLSVVLVVVVIALVGWLWWKNIFMNPQRVMDDMVATSLQTTSVTKVVDQENGQNKAKQSIRLSFESEPMSRSVTEITQPGRDRDNIVVTETIGTKKADYVRYTKIDIAEKTTGLDSIVNVWASQQSLEANGAKPTFLNEAAVSIVPFGNLKQSDLDKMTKQAKDNNVYKYTSAKTKWQNGRPTIVYDLSIKPSDLIGLLKTYSQATGIGDPNQLNPEDYKLAGNLSVQLTIDVLSRQLTSISYPSSGRNEIYSGYGVKNTVKPPAQTITIQELQSRVQSISQ